MKVSDKELGLIKNLRTIQDQNAFTVGVATIEYYERVLEMLGKVRQTRQKQKDLGETILQSYGLDADKDTYTIDAITGEIRKLVVEEGTARYVGIEDG